MITTVTLNPAIDVNTQVEKLCIGHVNRVHALTKVVGGKGINVASVIKTLGGKVSVSGFLGKQNQQLFVDYFVEHAISESFIRVDGETRQNIKVIDQGKQVTELNFTGFSVTELEIERLLSSLLSLPEHSVVVIAGSLCTGVSSQGFLQFLASLKQANYRLYMDCSEAALAQAITVSPYLIKPNIDELEQYFGESLTDINILKQRVAGLLERGITQVLLSMGAAGVIWFSKDKIVQLTAPKVEVESTVGAGDTLLGAFIYAEQYQKFNCIEQVLSFATAAAAFSVASFELSSLSYPAVMDLMKQVSYQELPW